MNYGFQDRSTIHRVRIEEINHLYFLFLLQLLERLPLTNAVSQYQIF